MSRTKRNKPASFLRHPKSLNEKKAADGLVAECKEEGIEVKLRPARNPRHLPDAWDDKPVAALKEQPSTMGR